MYSILKNCYIAIIMYSIMTPKYIEIEKQLRSDIMSGRISHALPAERSLAEQFGVSYLTVRRAVGNLVDKGLLSREHGRGIFVSTPKREVTRTMGLGFVVPERVLSGIGELSPYYLEVFSGAVVAAQQAGYHLILESDIEKIVPLENSHGARKVDAILAVCPDYPELFRDAAKFVPVIMLGHNYPSENFPSVFVDDFAGARMAVNYLIEQGHRKIVHLAGNKHNLSFYSRLCGYRKALEDHNIALRPEYELSDEKESLPVLAEMMKNKETTPTAVFGVNDGACISVIKYFVGTDTRLPKDLSLIGFDNLKYSDVCQPELTTVAVPKVAIGVQGVAKAIQALDNVLSPDEYREEIKLKLIIRNSVKSLE